MGMFWGLTVEPKKKYTQTVEYPFTVTSAAVDPSGSNDDTVLYLVVDGSEYVLCTLNKTKWPQHRLDTTLNEGAEITFYVRGDSKVHLVGYLEPSEYDSDEDLDSDEMEGMMGSDEELEEVDFDEMGDDDEEDDEDEDEEDEEEGEPKFVEIDEEEEVEEDDGEEGEEGWETDSEDQEEPEPNAAGKRPAKEGAGKQPPKKIVVTDGAKKDSGKVEVQKADKQAQQKQQKQKQEQQPAKTEQQQKQKQEQQPAKKEQQQKKQEHPAKKEPQQQEKKGKAQKLEGGTIAEDVVIGKGPKAKSGKMVGVYYVGRLAQNNKIFDACQSGKPFKFKLGKGEVIRGWDIGVDGMQVGGKRILRIPPGSAYGARGHPPVIPGNSTLIFEVELKFVK